jgi:response regulator RpfG family c-di-GMP phosphodiesterase
MISILVAEDDPNLLEMISVFLEARLGATVFQADKVSLGIDLLNRQSEISFVVSDYNLTDGNGGEIFAYLRGKGSNIPFFLCSSQNLSDCPEFTLGGLAGYIQKPFRARDLSTTVVSTIKELSGLSNLETSKYCSIRLMTFLTLGLLPCDVYLKLSEIKYVKIFNTGQAFGNAEFTLYITKNIRELSIRSEDVSLFLNTFSQSIFSLCRAKTLPSDTALEASTLGHHTLQRIASSIGFTSEAQTLARSCTHLALRVIMRDSATAALARKFFLPRINYLNEHSISLAQISCMIASLLGLGSENTFFKLAFAAVMHDITLENDDVASIEISIPSAQNLAAPVYSKFCKHPTEVASLLETMQDIPDGIASLILTHHQRPDGTDSLTTLPPVQPPGELEILPSIFIVAHDLVNYMWLVNDDPALTGFLKLYANEYTSGHFKRILETIKEGLQNLPKT